MNTIEIHENHDPIITNPIVSYSIREDGYITIYLEGDTGERARLLFDDETALASAQAGLEAAGDVLEVFYEYGFPEASQMLSDYVDDLNVDLTEDDIQRLLEGE